MLGGVLLGGMLGFLMTFSPALAWLGQAPIRLLGEVAQTIASWTGFTGTVDQLGLEAPLERLIAAAALGLAAAVILGAARGKATAGKIVLSAAAGAIAVGNTAVEWASIGRPDPTAWEVLPLVIAALAAIVVVTSAAETSADKAGTDASA